MILRDEMMDEEIDEYDEVDALHTIIERTRKFIRAVVCMISIIAILTLVMWFVRKPRKSNFFNDKFVLVQSGIDAS